MPESTISTSVAYDDLTGTVCKGCGREKRSGMSHCRHCYFALPKRVRAALYRRIGSGYEAAYSESLGYLHARRGAP